jgi:transcriptional regulator of arginine metabolism
MPLPNSDQSERRAAILELLTSGTVATQQALVRALTARGLKVTQSSVSRDLRDIGAVKTAEGYSMPAVDRDAEQELAAVAPLVRSTSAAGAHLLVIKTATGAAQRVALALDRSGWPEIVGNIGGDDTVFVATTSSSGQKLLKSRIERARAS